MREGGRGGSSRKVLHTVKTVPSESYAKEQLVATSPNTVATIKQRVSEH